MGYVNSVNKNNSDTFNTLLAFGHTFINTQNEMDTKTITFPEGYDVTDISGATSMAFKVVFTNGHAVTNSSTQFTINGVVVVANKDGVLTPLTPYGIINYFKYLQANTCLELYYTSNYDGNGTPAYVIVGNPIALKRNNPAGGSPEIIYVDGSIKTINLVEQNNYNSVSSNAVYTAITNEATARDTAITNAINNLDVTSVGGNGKYISAISEADGKISATATTMDTTPTASSTKAVTSGGVKSYVDNSLTNYYANKISSTDSGVNGAIWIS